jgi:hypothetical protein
MIWRADHGHCQRCPATDCRPTVKDLLRLDVLLPWLSVVCCRIALYGIKRAALGGADMAEFVVLLVCPLRAEPACCARPDGRARAGRPDGGDARQRSWTPQAM